MMIRALLVALALLLSAGLEHEAHGQAGIAGVRSCSQSVIYDANTNGATQLFPLSNGAGNGGQIYICGYTIFSGGTVTVELDANTATSCGGTTTKIAGAWALTAQAQVNDTSPFYRGLNVPANQVLCIKTNQAVQVQALVYFSQDRNF